MIETIIALIIAVALGAAAIETDYRVRSKYCEPENDDIFGDW